MEKVPKGSFTKEFKEEAVKMVTEGNLPVPEAGRRLSVPESTLANRVKKAKENSHSDKNKKQRQTTADQMEFARLKREIAELKMVLPK